MELRVWNFLASNDLYDILSFALELEWDHSTIPIDEKTRSIPILFLDVGRIMRNRSSGKERQELEEILEGLPLRLGLYKNRSNHVRPFFMTETSYKLVPSDYSNALTRRWCWVEITKEVNTFGYKPCRGFAVKEDGDRVHLRGPDCCHKQCQHEVPPIPGLVSCGSGCSWKRPTQNHLDVDDLKTLADKMRRITRLRDHLREKDRGTSNLGRPDVYLTATPGTTTRKGLYCDPEYRHGGTLSDKGFDFERGVTSVANYIACGISSQSFPWTVWKPQHPWTSCKTLWKSVVKWFRNPTQNLPWHRRGLLRGSGVSSITGQSTLDSLPPSVRAASPFHFV